MNLGWRGLLFGAGLAVLAGEVLGRAAGFGALGAGPRTGHKVALTFDDGPSDRTPELLRVLAKHGAKATFFVTQPACEAFPEALADLQAAGHQTESHGRWHTHALLLGPVREWAQIAWQPVPAAKLYRPPYGGHSPLTRLFARLLGRQIALWDTEGRDWTGGRAAELAQHTAQRVQAGSVILLHDGPAVTPELLDLLLQDLASRGLQSVRLDELPMRQIGWDDGLRRLWQSYGG